MWQLILSAAAWSFTASAGEDSKKPNKHRATTTTSCSLIVGILLLL